MQYEKHLIRNNNKRLPIIITEVLQVDIFNILIEKIIYFKRAIVILIFFEKNILLQYKIN